MNFIVVTQNSFNFVGQRGKDGVTSVEKGHISVRVLAWMVVSRYLHNLKLDE